MDTFIAIFDTLIRLLILTPMVFVIVVFLSCFIFVLLLLVFEVIFKLVMFLLEGVRAFIDTFSNPFKGD